MINATTVLVEDMHSSDLLSRHLTSNPFTFRPRKSRIAESMHDYIGLLSRLQAIDSIGMLINHKEKIHEVAANTTYVFKQKGLNETLQWSSRKSQPLSPKG